MEYFSARNTHLVLPILLSSISAFAESELPLNRTFGFGAEMMPINVYKNGIDVKPNKYKHLNLKQAEDGYFVDYTNTMHSAFATRTWDHPNGNFSRSNMEALKNADGTTKQVVYSENTNGYIQVSVLSLSDSKVKSMTECESPTGAAWVKKEDSLFCATVTSQICQKLYKPDTLARLKILRNKLAECTDLKKTATEIYQDIGMAGKEYDALMTENIEKINTSAATQKTVSPDGVASQSKIKKDRTRYMDFKKFDTIGESLSTLSDAFSMCQKLGLVDTDYEFPRKDGAKVSPQVIKSGTQTTTPVGEI